MREKGYFEFSGKFAKGRARPLAGHWDITGACNLDCGHCYRDRSGGAVFAHTGRALELADEMAHSGCLMLTVSGGEPLFHPDFKKIYSRIRGNGIQVVLFTNATLVGESLAGWLEDNPPLMIEVTLHSLRQEVFEGITGVRGSFAACMAGIENIATRRLALTIKTVAMRQNKNEIPAIKEFAGRHKAQFKFDTYVIAPFDSAGEAEQCRLPVEEAVAVEARDPQVIRQWKECLADYDGSSEEDGTLPYCPAGLYSFYLNPRMRLCLCYLLDQPCFDLTGKSFHEGFFEFLTAQRAGIYRKPADCLDCPADIFCGQCAARAFAECRDTRARVGYLCRRAKKRLEVFGRLSGAAA